MVHQLNLTWWLWVGEVDFPNGDGDHGPSSWPVTEDNSLGDQERRLSSGYGDDWDDDSSLSSY